MKKLIVMSLVILTCGALHALPVGNPSEASLFINGEWSDAWGVRLGFAGDYVFNRHMKSSESQGGGVHKTEIYTNAAYLALNICDSLDLFTRLGASKVNIESNSLAVGIKGFIPALPVEFEFGSDFFWSVGGRATIWEQGCFAVGVEGEYAQTNQSMNLYTDGAGDYFSIEGFNAKYCEWQAGIGASYRITTECSRYAMIPYLAIKWSGSTFDMGGYTVSGVGVSGTTLNLKNARDLGYAVGTSFTLCDMIGVTVEGRFGDEQAVYVNGQFRF